MVDYNIQYKKLIKEEVVSLASKMTRSKFYRIREYKDIDGKSKKYAELKAPIIFTLYVSRPKDIVHAVKISFIKPALIKRFFGKFVNEDTATIEIKGTSKTIYNTIVNKMPFITEDAYRVYKLSGIKRVSELDMQLTKLTPRNKKAIDLDDPAVRDTLEGKERY